MTATLTQGVRIGKGYRDDYCPGGPTSQDPEADDPDDGGEQLAYP